jgi:acetyl esterase/lipase
VIFYSHGGGFVGGSIYTHRKMVGHLAKAVGCRALIFDYPYAHQRKYPAQLDAAFAAYNWRWTKASGPGTSPPPAIPLAQF